MKLYQTIAIFDVVVAAENETDARETLAKWIHGWDGTETPLGPSELTGREITQEREIRSAMREAKPIVGLSISNADFEKLKGKTNLEMFVEIYSKPKSK